MPQDSGKASITPLTPLEFAAQVLGVDRWSKQEEVLPLAGAPKGRR